MRSDALDVPSDPEAPPEAQDPASTQASGDGWALPANVTLAAGVSIEAADPSDVGGPRRQCVAATKAGPRCSAPALGEEILCAIHAGRVDPAAGGHARARKLRLVREGAENRAAEARLGTRAVVSAALAEKHEQIRTAIHGLADRAADGDRAAALALIPWINQGLGMPATSGSIEVSTPEGEQALDALDTASLRALLHASP
jgi:hypothetical protein